MRKFLCIAAMAVISGATVAQAAGIPVTTDSGNIGEFSLTNIGISGSTSTLVFNVPSVFSTLDTVNGVFVPPVFTAVNTPLMLEVTSTGGGGYNLALVPPTYQQTIGAVPGSQAQLAFDLTKGATIGNLPNFFNASGDITALLANALPGYDFAQFAAGGEINFTLTSTTFTGANSFASLFSTVGASAVGNGSFSEVAIPEPASAVLLGIGLCALLALRRLTAIRWQSRK